MFSSCKKRDIKGEVIDISNIALSIKSEDGRVVIPTDSNYTKTPEALTIPLELSFSDAAPKRFNVDVSADNDTINKLISDGTLKNTVLLPSELYELPSNLDAHFGVDHLDFNLKVDITALERNYGKNLALAVKLSDPTKNNTLDKKEAIVIINTSKTITPEEIHYIYFKEAGQVSDIPPKEGATYAQNSTYVTIPVTVSLGGIAAGGFNVRLAAVPDTVQKLIDDHVLQNTTLLNAGTDYIFPDSIDFLAKKNEASFDLNVKVDVLLNHYNEQVALALALDDPNSHLLDSTKRTIVLKLNPPGLVEFDVTNLNSTLTVERENVRTGEVSSNLVDNQINTKFLLFDFYGVWAQLEFDTAQVTGAYTITSANDAPGRDPKAWQLLGSNNGANWKVLDAQKNQSFSARFQTKKYYFSDKTAYKYYRLQIQETADGSGSLMQLAEWRLIRTP